jgi:hypothetical protein
LMQDLGRGEDGNSIWADALRGRVRELEARGLATEVRRNVMVLREGWQDALSANSPMDISKTRNATRAYERGELLVGEIVGIEQRQSGNTILILDAGDKGKVMVNTKSNIADHLQDGSWVRLEADGKISRLSYHSLEQQLGAVAFTELDHELERIGNGDVRLFEGNGRIDEALATRAGDHARAGLGSIDEGGTFTFQAGARDALHNSEMGAFIGDLKDQGRGSVSSPQSTFRDGWRIREFSELHSGRIAVLERAQDIKSHLTLAPAPLDSALKVGDGITPGGVGRGGVVRMVQDLDFGLELGR